MKLSCLEILKKSIQNLTQFNDVNSKNIKLFYLKYKNINKKNSITG